MDLNIYTTEMSKSIWDKSFFMDKIPGAKCVIDFGCADGAMIRYLSTLFPDTMFVGYDICSELIERARSIPPFNANLIYFIGNKWDGAHNVYEYVSSKFQPEEICLNFSCVLHEVFSSTGGKSEITFLADMLKPKYITIRDMYCDDPVEFVSTTHFQITHQIASNSELNKYGREFIKNCGCINNWRDMTHLLMKLQWIDNGWNNELKENYFSWTINDFIKLVGNKYSPVFECRYQLPYLSEKWKEEYGFFNPDLHTHAQFILRRDE